MRFRFSIRDLLWLTALVALAVAWWLDHRRQDALNANSNAFVEALLSRNDGIAYTRKLLGELETGHRAALTAKNPAAVAQFDLRISEIQQQLLEIREQLRVPIR